MQIHPGEKKRGSERLRLMLFTDNFRPGGTERFILRLAQGLDRRRFEVLLGAFSEEGAWRSEVPGDVEVICFPITQGYLKKDGLTQMLRLAGFLRHRRVDILYTNHYFTNVIGALASTLSGVRLVVGQRGRIIPNRRRDRLANSFADWRAVRIIANSMAMLEEIRQSEPLNMAKTFVVHNGIPTVDRALFQARREVLRRSLGVQEKTALALCVARLCPEKGQGDLLEALARLGSSGRDIVLVLAGDGEDEDILKHRAAALGVVGSVRFLGHVAQVQPLLAAADLFVLPSRTESFPNALLEAMQFGLPCVASAVGGVPEILRDGENGRLVPAASIARLTGAILSVVEDEEGSARLGRQAAETIAANYTLERMIRRIEDILTETAG